MPAKGQYSRPDCRICGVELNAESCKGRRKNGAICNRCRVDKERKRYFDRVAADPEHNKKRWARRRETHNQQRRIWNAAHKDVIRRRNYQAKFGITPEEIDRMFARQGKVCACCGDAPKDGVPRVDHKHGTKIIRGLLCDRCNAGIGMFLDDPHRLYKAMIYLTRAKEAVA